VNPTDMLETDIVIKELKALIEGYAADAEHFDAHEPHLADCYEYAVFALRTFADCIGIGDEVNGD
jgi:hypothetical protein